MMMMDENFSNVNPSSSQPCQEPSPARASVVNKANTKVAGPVIDLEIRVVMRAATRLLTRHRDAISQRQLSVPFPPLSRFRVSSASSRASEVPKEDSACLGRGGSAHFISSTCSFFFCLALWPSGLRLPSAVVFCSVRPMAMAWHASGWAGRRTEARCLEASMQSLRSWRTLTFLGGRRRRRRWYGLRRRSDSVAFL